MLSFFASHAKPPWEFEFNLNYKYMKKSQNNEIKWMKEWKKERKKDGKEEQTLPEDEIKTKWISFICNHQGRSITQ
jgi:ADP-heptose:LPS heptosyltransferase